MDFVLSTLHIGFELFLEESFGANILIENRTLVAYSPVFYDSSRDHNASAGQNPLQKNYVHAQRLQSF